MRLRQVLQETMQSKAQGPVNSVNVAQGEDGTAVLCLACFDKKGRPVGYFNTWRKQEDLRQWLKLMPSLKGVPLFVDMMKVGSLPEAAEKVGAPIATA